MWSPNNCMVLKEVGYKVWSGLSWHKVKFRGGVFEQENETAVSINFGKIIFDQMRDCPFPKETKMCLDRWLVNLSGTGCTHFPKIYKSPQNSRRQGGDMKQVSQCGPINIRGQRAKFSRHCELAPRSCEHIQQDYIDYSDWSCYCELSNGYPMRRENFTQRRNEIWDTSGLQVKFLLFWFVTSCTVAGVSVSLVTTSKSVRYHIPPYEGTLCIVGAQKKLMKGVSAKISTATP